MANGRLLTPMEVADRLRVTADHVRCVAVVGMGGSPCG